MGEGGEGREECERNQPNRHVENGDQLPLYRRLKRVCRTPLYYSIIALFTQFT